MVRFAEVATSYLRERRKRKSSLNNQEISTLITRLYATKEHELLCSQIHELLPVYVEAEFEGEPLETAVVHDIETHLQQCPDCTELYQGLCFLVELEAKGDIHLADPPHPTPTRQRESGTLTPVAGS
jgi:hypothetical protein